MLKFFKSKPANSLVNVDMHSHLIPEIDDGVKSYEESIEMIKEMMKLGYTEFITTPHIMGDFYKNSPETILPRLEELKSLLKAQNVDVKVSAAAEYYLDEWFIEKVHANEKLLVMGDNYLLVETSYMNKPRQLEEILFELKTKGYKPILAHPERYTYMYEDFGNYNRLFDTGVYFQINLNSLSGYYSDMAKNVAKKLIDKQMVHFIGTDLHGRRHLDVLSKSMKTKTYSKLENIHLLNDQLGA